MADIFCSHRIAQTPLVYDHTREETICSECGRVLQSQCVVESTEWPTFPDDSDNDDPILVGSPSNPLLSNGGLGSSTSTLTQSPPKGSSSSHDATILNQWQNTSVWKPGRQIHRAFKTIDEMADNLGLDDAIKKEAKGLYKKAGDEKIISRLRHPRALMSACLYVACKEEGFPRRWKEIRNVANGAKKKDIYKAVEALKKRLEVGSRTIDTKDIARRYCSNLGLSNQIIKAVQETLQKTEKYDIRRSSGSILAAAIFMVSQLSEKKKSYREVAKAADVSDTTLRKAYRDLCRYASDIIPSWYAEGKNLKALDHL